MSLDTTRPLRPSRSSRKSAASLGLLWVHPHYPFRFDPLEGGRELTIGRDEQCDIALEAPQLSRRHATLRRSAESWVLSDLNSTNGTHCNARRVSQVTLEQGQVLRLGSAVGLVVRSSQPPTLDEVAPGIMGGPVMARALRGIERAAQSDLHAIVQGPSGTGKERVARAIHALSSRTGAFVAVNCAAIPAQLAESELFGHAVGAFTGATKSKPGHFLEAAAGTLFLDEVNELSLELQAKLLRVIEERSVVPVGRSHPLAVNTRIVVASQAKLADLVREGTFREDLFARLDGFSVALPPLSERREEVPHLLRFFLDRFFGGRIPALDPEFVELSCLYSWPLNVRELETFSKRLAVLHGDRHLLTADQLPENVRDPNAEITSEGQPLTAELLHRTLAACDGNVARASQQLGISRQRIYRIIADSPELDLGHFRGKADP